MNDVLLTSGEMLTFNARLAQLTDGRLAVGPEAITRGQARALWAAMKAFHVSPAALMPPRSPRRRSRELHRTGAAVALSAAAALSGCATLGGNVKGSFACRAPDGMCAPTSKIDDQALAMISGGDSEPVPAGVISPYDRPDPRFIPTTVSAAPGRSSEKVLRIVFPAHVDSQGRFREASAIHAVVERGTWMAASDGRAPPVVGMVHRDDQQLAMAERSPSLAELAAASPEVAFPQSAAETATPVAVSSAMPAASSMPSPAAVAAARTRVQPVKTSVRAAAVVTQPALGSQTQGRTALQLASTSALSAITPGGVRTGTSSAPSLNAVPGQPAFAASAPLTTPVPAFDLRSAGTTSPLQSIREQVGSIFAARGMAPKTVTPAKPSTPERPVNGPSVLSVSEVNQ